MRIVLTPRIAGASINSATVSAEQHDPTPADATSSLAISVVPGTDLQIIRQYQTGSRRYLTSIVLVFNAPLINATDLSYYSIYSAGRDKKLGTRDDRPIRLRSAVYDVAADHVSIYPAARLSLSINYLIRASGISSTDGAILDGARNGRSGSLYRAIFHGLKKYRLLGP